MSEFQKKYFVFIISAGRTGTRFLGKTLDKMIEKSYSVHEPDVFTFKKGYNLKNKLRNFGFYQLLIGKLLGKTGIRNLSQNYLAGQLSLPQLTKQIKKHRQKFYENVKEYLIIESYSGWFGCIDAIKGLYDNYKIVIITRDPRDWITSVINWGSLYGKNDWLTRLGISRLNPKLINDKEYIEKWNNFSKLEKLCWTYKTYYEVIIKQTRGLENVKFLKFEDLFYSNNRYKNFTNLLKFVAEYDDKYFNYKLIESILEKKVHASKNNNFPEYKEWKEKERIVLKNICRDVSQKLGYQLRE